MEQDRNSRFCPDHSAKRRLLVLLVGMTMGGILYASLSPSSMAATLEKLLDDASGSPIAFVISALLGALVATAFWRRTKQGASSERAPAALDPSAAAASTATPKTTQPNFPAILSLLPGTACSVLLSKDGKLSMPYASRDLRTKYGFPEIDLSNDLRPLFSAIPVSDHEPLKVAFLKSAADLSPLQVEFRLITTNGDTVWARGSGVPERCPDGSTIWNGFVQDITCQKMAEMSADRLDRGRTMLLEISRTLIESTLDAGGLAHQIFAHMNEQMGIDIGLNYRICGSTLHLIAAHGLTAEAQANAKTLQFGQAVCGNVAKSGAPIIVDFDRIQSDDMCEFVRAAGAKCYMCYPIRARDGRLFGTIAFGSRTRERYSHHFHELLTLLVAYLGLAWERIEAENVSAGDRSRLQHALDVSGLGLFDHDLVTGEFYASEQFRSIVLEPPGAPLTQDSLLSKLKPEDRLQVEANVRRARDPNGDGIHKAEYHLSTLDGQDRWLAINAVVQFDDEDGVRKPVRSIGTIADITARKSEEVNRIKLLDALAVQEAAATHQKVLFQGVFDSAPDAIMLTDVACKIQHVNRAFLETFRFTEDDLVGHPSNVVYTHAVEAKSIRELALDHEKNPVMAPRKITFQRGDGTHFIGEMSGAVLTTDTGDRIGYIGLVRDTTEDIAREQALQKAQRLEAIGRVTGGVAHDFNNILTVLSGNLQFISRVVPEGAARGFVDEAGRAIERGARLTRQMMTFAQQRQLSPDVIKLNDIITGMINLIETSAGETIHVHTSLEEALKPTRLDRMEMENALLNLVLNARDAMPNGGTIFIRTRNVIVDTAGGDRLLPGTIGVELQVQDTGHGMPANVLNRVFEPYFTTKDTGKGSGLGLAIVHGFVRQSGGAIAVESAPGKGTTVTITLPSVAKRTEPGLMTDDTVDVPSSKGETILVVEDDEAVRRVSVGRIQALGYRALEAGNGRAALDLLATPRGADVSLVLSDVIMPGGVNGTELYARISSEYPNVAVVLATGYAKSALNAPAPLPADAIVLEKPYSYEQLATSIRFALDRQGRNSYRPDATNGGPSSQSIVH